MAAKVGYVQQLKGPFTASVNVLAGLDIAVGNALKIGISIDPKDFMKLGRWGFSIDDEYIEMGKTCIYELDTPKIIGTLRFPTGAPNSVKVEIVVYE